MRKNYFFLGYRYIDMSNRHFHHTLPSYPNNFVHVKRMSANGRIHHLDERVNPRGEIEVLRQHGNRYVVAHVLDGKHTHHNHSHTHASATHKAGAVSRKSDRSSEQILKDIYAGFGKASSKGIRK